ncbi:MAG: glycosyltransferase family 4 protein [Vicinamibacteria bacterium]
MTSRVTSPYHAGLLDLLFTATAYPPSIGGAQLYLHSLARALASRHRVRVAAQWDTHRTDWLLGTTLRGGTAAARYEYEGVPVHRIALPAAARWRLLPWVAAYYALQGPALRRIAGALADQIRSDAEGASLVHNCRIGREGLTAASLLVARERGVPFVLTPVHHPRWGSVLHRHYHRLYREADAVIALTEAERRALTALGVDERRVFVTGMGPILGTDARGARFRTAHRLGDAPLVLFLGQKYAYKGADRLLAAAAAVWSRHPDARFAFLGARTAHSRRVFAGVRDPRVIELGEVSLEEKTDALDASDVFCLPSTQESFGGVFTEAWSLGKPVVGCAIPAVSAVVEHGADGLVSEPEPAALSEALNALLDDPARRQALGARGREKVARLYTWARLAERTEEVYRAALAGR